MSPLTKAREAACQAGEQYGRRVAELSSPLLTPASLRDTVTDFIRPVFQHIDKQAETLRGKGMDPELVQLWAGAAAKAASERLRELPLVIERRKSLRHRS
jgi:hypothetical protein